MNLDLVINFLSADHDLCIGYSGITFLKVEELNKGQIGYSRNEDGNSFIDGQEGYWREEWLVIGQDELLGDPIFVDTKSEALTVFSAIHGEGKWEPYIVAHSFSNFINIIEHLKIISENRENPVALESNPLSIHESEQFLYNIKHNNPFADIQYWKGFLEE